MKLLIASTSIFAAITSTAAAEGLSYGFLGYDFTNFDNGTNAADVSQLEGDIEYEVNQFLFSAEINSTVISEIDTNEFTSYALGAAYKISPEILAGAGIIGANSDSDDSTGFEVFGQYRTEQFGVSLNHTEQNDAADTSTTSLVGEYTAAPGVTLSLSLDENSSFDETVYQFTTQYDLGPIDVRGYYLGFSDNDIGVLGARGTYNVTPEIRVSGAYQVFTGDDAPDANAIVIGGGYKVADTVWVDAQYGLLTGDSFFEDINRLTLQLTFETGTRQRLDDQFEQDSLDDLQSGFGTLFF